MKAKTEAGLIGDCHGGTEVNLVTALGFYSMFGYLERLLNLEQKHEMVTAIRVEVFPGVLQTKQKHIGKWREAIEVKMNIRKSETYHRLSGARYSVGSTLAPMCSGCREYNDDRGSSFLSAKTCKNCEDVGEILRIAIQDVCRSSRKNQR